MAATKATPISEVAASRPAEDVLQERLGRASDTIDRLEAFRRYSSERCIELNSDGASWECPEDTVGLPIDEDTLAEDEEALDAIIARLDPPRC